jgi:hypothetical protein
MKYSYFLPMFLFVCKMRAQSVAINTNGAAANASAILDVSSTNKGLLLPRLTKAQKNAIATPAAGLLVYQTSPDSVGFHYYDGTKWLWLQAEEDKYWAANGNNIYNRNTGNIGIGTNTPVARLHVEDSSVVFTGQPTLPATPGDPPISGAGTRMMWYPDKAAFRVGNLSSITSTYWDRDSIGQYSFGAGWVVRAKGIGSIALGIATIASGTNSFASGQLTIASGNSSFASGLRTIASEEGSTAFGSTSKALGRRSTAMGSAFATNYASTAMGDSSNASGLVSTAMGFRTIASGNLSTAMGDSSNAYGAVSTAMGSSTIAKGYASTTIGMYNDSILSINQAFM